VGLYVQRPIGDKPVERFAKELEWIFGAAGGTSLSIYDFGALVSHDAHRRALREASACAASGKAP